MDKKTLDMIYMLTGGKFRVLNPSTSHSSSELDATACKPLPKLTGHHPPSTASLASLSSITLQKLQPNTRHHGKVIYLCIGSTRHESGTYFTVTDRTGAAGQIWSLLAHPLGVEMVASGIVVAIKEPYFGINPSETTTICLHHPTDCVRISKRDTEIFDELFPSLLTAANVDCIRSAEMAFIGGDYLSAMDLYSLAMDTLQSEERQKNESQLLTKRAFAETRIGALNSALCTAQAAVRECSSFPALELAASTALRYGETALAGEYATRLAEHPETARSDSQRTSYQKILQRITVGEQQKTGAFDFSAVRRAVLTNGVSPDVISFTGSIEVRPSALGGRGMFASESIPAGALLLCEKPAALGMGHKKSGYGEGMLDLPQGEKTSGRVLHLLSQLASKVVVDPTSGLNSKIFALHDGRQEMSERDGLEHFDVYRAVNILKHNQHTILPGCTSDHHDASDPANKSPPSRTLATATDQTPGLWLQASMFNHSCLPNCCWSWIGELFIVRAMRDIFADEELTLPYVPNSYDREKRQSILKSHNGFECTCLLCVADAAVSDEVQLRRKTLQMTLKPGPKVTISEQNVKELMSTYEHNAYNGLPRILMADAFLQLANAKLGHINRWKSASTESTTIAKECFIACLEIGLGIKLLYAPDSSYCELLLTFHSQAKAVGVLALMGRAELAFHDKDLERCAALKACAKELYKTVYGEDDSFEEKHPSYSCRGVSVKLEKKVQGEKWEELKEKSRGQAMRVPKWCR